MHNIQIKNPDKEKEKYRKDIGILGMSCREPKTMQRIWSKGQILEKVEFNRGNSTQKTTIYVYIPIKNQLGITPLTTHRRVVVPVLHGRDWI